MKLPNDWRSRYHQRPFVDYMLKSTKNARAYLIWHRRAGKDSTCINLTALLSHLGTPGTYWHLLPTSVQARRVVWNGIDGQGRRIIDQAFPEELRETTNTQDMFIQLKCGSAWQLAGSDNYNSLVGANVKGVIFSEWALCDPTAWNYIRPILLENQGWAVFITTPRGRNHCWQMYEQVRDNPEWFVQHLTVDDTRREDGTRIFTDEMLQSERDSGMSEEMVAQEYYCSFAAGVVGSYYGREMEKARDEGRIGKVPHDRRLPVHTYWDIGIDDSTAVWFGQREGFQRRWIDYMEFSDTALMDIYEHLNGLPYRYGIHHFPHDARQRNKDTGRRTLEYADDIFDGNGDVTVVPIHSVEQGIEATRYLIGQSWFDEDACKRGIDCLLNYQKKWDEKNQVYALKPLHSWASHGADAFRMAAWMDADEPVHENVMDYATKATINVRRSIR